MKTKHKTSDNDKRNLKVAAMASGSRGDFLAAHPEARKLQTAHLKEITRRIGNYRKSIKLFATELMNKANEARAIGVLIMDFLDTLPGKQLTTDFWQQMEGLFVDPHGQKITQDNLKWFVKIARLNPAPITAPL